MPAPPTATAAVFPDWTNIVDNWREVDAEWLRNRSIHIFPDAAGRSVLNLQTFFGMMSIIPQIGQAPGGPDFWNGTAWESVRYPNMSVSSDSTSVTMRRQGASPFTGIQLINDGSANIATLVAGSGTKTAYTGSLLDVTGLSMKVGGKTVKLVTDANGLVINDGATPTPGPVTVALTGSLSATNTIAAPTITSTTVINAKDVSFSSGGTITGAAAITGTAVTGSSTVTGGSVVLGTTGVYGTIKHTAPAATGQISLGSDSSVIINGAALTLSPPVTLTNTGTALTVNGVTNLVGQANLAQTGKTVVAVAGAIFVSGNVAPTQNAPDGTIYITY